ncbi:hypothetical protein P7H74_08060 [Enterococcus devriesei]|uniref:hypothetical protein n=1 Tax=Enterococcus devriesei TaxID=319970 RepID=UPI001C100D51|nr:hypothetical protein [Enterococcus devriesei]MBU5366177.1 hypothetical protein [Enterococcus devriesei]MDT2821708.1 hypothetical protein [Enterococcus devriesei]
MSDYKISFKVDGRIVPEKEILEMELSRYHQVFHIFDKKNIPIHLDEQEVSLSELLQLPLNQAKIALAQTREALGKERTLELFASEIERGDAMWHEIAGSSEAGVNMQTAYVEVETENITLEQFMMFNQHLMKENNLYLPSTIHPEHYYFDANSKGEQIIVETFGMYKDPSYLDLKPGSKADYPVRPAQDVDLVMAGKTYLANDHSDTKMLGMHQLSKTDNGMKVKLGVFLPENAPKEIAEGHKWHLMVEFNNGLHIAAQQHPNFFQKKVMDVALNRIKKQQEE